MMLEEFIKENQLDRFCENTLGYEIFKNRVEEGYYKDKNGRIYTVLEIRYIGKSMDIDVGGTERVVPLNPHLEDIKIR